ncbi:isopentenyl-diphosphate Delta-isomerase [Roseivirga sp. BDSF3-8]|uniref:isopentenyl-diphosphate Delta-isomerase n=1 Tax=Roseivirga sp. BDSF3-8 TaxID=3241598 RepID=UPI0035321C2D
MVNPELVILVDEQDRPVGTEEKMEAHRRGFLHRAFSVIIYNDAGDMLLHKRALTKYHSPGLWTNACCSHPRPEETVIEAATRRLQEEMGFATSLQETSTFIYRADVGGGLIEHEYDHLLTGIYNAPPAPNPGEVAEWAYVPMEEVIRNVKNHPERYTEWFKIILEKI